MSVKLALSGPLPLLMDPECRSWREERPKGSDQERASKSAWPLVFRWNTSNRHSLIFERLTSRLGAREGGLLFLRQIKLNSLTRTEELCRGKPISEQTKGTYSSIKPPSRTFITFWNLDTVSELGWSQVINSKLSMNFRFPFTICWLHHFRCVVPKYQIRWFCQWSGLLWHVISTYSCQKKSCISTNTMKGSWIPTPHNSYASLLINLKSNPWKRHTAN